MGWMRAMDIFVLPSDTENFPNVLLEAMRLRGDRFARWRHSGTDRGGPQRLLFDTGDPEDLAKALSTLIQDAALRTQLRTAAAERARAHFSLAHSVRCIETV